MKKDQFLKLWLRIRQHKRLFKANHRKFLKWTKWLLLSGIALVTLGVGGLFLSVLPSLPDINNIENLVAAQSSEILDREGNLLYTIHGEENREVIPLETIPQHVVDAVLAIEDDQFYSHRGVDFGAIMKAVCSEVGLCTARGGSTITQQFIKNAFLSSERTYTRKLKEIILALQLEGLRSKDEILEMYLNRIPYGSSIYGIERAANAFFGKAASELTVAEGAILAAIPKAPTYFSPYGNHKHAIINLDRDEVVKMSIRSEQELIDISPDFITKGLLGKTHCFDEGFEEPVDEELEEVVEEDGDESDEEVIPELPPCDYGIYVKGRVDFVLNRMLSLGMVDEAELEMALLEAETKQFTEFRESIKAPHFVFYVREILEEKYGKEAIEKGGLKITTTIDPKLQEAAELAVETYAEQNMQRYGASNASLLSMDPNDGQILAMVGSVDYFNDEIDGKVNVAIRPRLPGSSFKPIAYAAAFLQGYAPSTVLYDVRTKFGAWYEPENYDGEFRGPVTMRHALSHSLNIPAVKAGYLAGIPNILDLARKMGISLNQPDDWYGLSLALGAGEARLIDMVMAYSIFANGGYKMDPVGILKIEDRNGNILEEFDGPVNRSLTLDPQVAYLVNHILSDIDARPEGWWRDQLSIPGQVNAAKTGTSNKEIGYEEKVFPFDTWTIGYTRRLATGVWAGNNNGDHLKIKASGLDTAGRMWHDFMVAAVEALELPREEFERPEGIKYVPVSDKTGLLPSDKTPPDTVKTGIFASFGVPREYDESYQIVEIDKASGKLATEYTPEAAIEEKAFFEHHAILPDNANWEEGVRTWAEENNEDEEVPTEYDDIHTPENANQRPKISITSPSTLSNVSLPSVGVWVNISSKAPVRFVEYYWDDELVDTATRSPYKGTIPLKKKGNRKGSKHTIRAVVYDQLYHSDASSVEVKIGDDETPPRVSFDYPASGVKLDANTSMATQANAYDPNGDIDYVEFYLNGQLEQTVQYPPYILQFFVPSTVGEHTIRAVAYDYAGNKGSKELEFKATKPDVNEYSGASRLVEPFKNESFDEGERILLKAYLDDEAQDNLKEMTVMAKRKGEKTIEIAKVLGAPGGGGAVTYTFLWDSAPAGTYELSLKIVLEDGKIRFSQRVPVVVR